MGSQIFIFLFGVSAIYLVGRKDKWKKYGYILGLMSQPFWFYTSIKSGQYGIFLMTLFYTWSWSHGIGEYWNIKDFKDLHHLFWLFRNMIYQFCIGEFGEAKEAWYFIELHTEYESTRIEEE